MEKWYGKQREWMTSSNKQYTNKSPSILQKNHETECNKSLNSMQTNHPTVWTNHQIVKTNHLTMYKQIFKQTSRRIFHTNIIQYNIYTILTINYPWSIFMTFSYFHFCLVLLLIWEIIYRIRLTITSYKNKWGNWVEKRPPSNKALGCYKH